VSVDPAGREEFLEITRSRGLKLQPLGRMVEKREKRVKVM